MSPVTASYMWDRGCELGNGSKYQGGGVTDYVVVLDFGAPWLSGSTYGAKLWSGTTGQFESTTWIADKVEQYAYGFYQCSPTTVRLNIVVGVNSDSSAVGSGHATAWASMVTTIDNWISTEPHNIVSQVWAHGGIDIESGFYASASMDRSWVAAYSTKAGPVSWTYDFGDAAGCPYATYTSSPGYRCSGTSGCKNTTRGCYYQDDYFYVSWRCGNCKGLPEIYNTTLVTLPNGTTSDHNAQSWEGIRRYGHYSLGIDNQVDGTTTQYTSCHVQGHSCPGTNNTQVAGWTHLTNSINAYTPAGQGFTMWSNDFMWGF